MKHLASILALALEPTLAAAAEKPEWAFPVTDKDQPPPRYAPDRVRTVGNVSVTRAGADDMYNIPNWRPDMYLPIGTGHDESAYMAGVTQRYFGQQMTDWKNGNRKFGGTMVAMAKVITDAEIKDAADYFAKLKPRPWIRVVETDTVPKTFIGPGNKRLEHPAGGTEPIGNRIIEVPEDEEAVVYRDPISGFVAYVPKGSIAKGETLVKTGGGKSTPCIMCHGTTLKGLADWPGLAGRHPNYIVRQLWNMQNGERVGPATELMRPVVQNLTN